MCVLRVCESNFKYFFLLDEERPRSFLSVFRLGEPAGGRIRKSSGAAGTRLRSTTRGAAGHRKVTFSPKILGLLNVERRW